MKRLDVIPKPNKVEFLGGEVDPSELEITYIEDKSLADEAYVLTVVKSGIELRYLGAVIDYLAQLVLGEYIHIGGDEAPKKHWQSCPLPKVESGLTEAFPVISGWESSVRRKP